MMKLGALDRLGLPGVVGAGLLLFCVAFYFGTIAPAQEELANLAAEKAQLAAAQAGAHHARAAPVQALPSFAQAPELLKQLNALAEKHGVVVTRSSYQVKSTDGTRRFEIDMPLKIAYPLLRAYLRDALALSPTASLDDLNLQRAQATDPAVDADVRLSFSFAAVP
ncbi:MAG: type 4a pilus biogenesis protein PilO [Rhodocyclaceae bacterium]|nr:type 4a pilus biogenesis protein PilO [Rhodocyclaceae bacterium]